MSRWAALLLVAGVALGVRVANFRWMAAQPLTTFQFSWADGDMADHWQWAGRIAAGDWLSRDVPAPYPSWRHAIAPPETWERWHGRRVFYKAPLYPYVLAGMRAAVGESPAAISACHVALGFVNVLLVFVLALRYFDTATALVAGLVAALYGPALLYETLLLRDTLAVTVSLVLLIALSFCTGAARTPWLLAGVAFAIALLGRELVGPFAVLVLLWIWQRFRDHPATAAATGATFLVGVMLGLSPLAIRNVAVGVSPLSLSALGLEGIVYGHAVDSAPATFIVPAQTGAILQAADGRIWPAITGTLATYQGDWLRLVRNEAARTAAIFSGLEGADNVNWYFFAARSRLLRLGLSWPMVLGAGVVGIVLARRRVRRDDRIVLYYLLVSLLGLQFTAVMGRYRLVPAAVLSVYAAVSVVTVVRALRDRRWSAAAVPAVASACLVLVTARWLKAPGVAERCRPAEYLMSAQIALARQDASGIYAALDDCLACVQTHPDAAVMPPMFQAFARDYLTLAGRLGRGADATARLEGLRDAYVADPLLPQLVASARSTAPPQRQ